MSFWSAARLTFREPLTSPETGNRQVLPPRLLGVPTLPPAVPLSTKSVASTPCTASENVTSMLTLELTMVESGAGTRSVTVGGSMSKTWATIPWENSEVLFCGSVAVAVMNCPANTSVVSSIVKETFPLPSVVEVAAPRNLSPSP